MKTRHTLGGGVGLIAAIAMALPAAASMPTPAVTPSVSVIASAGFAPAGTTLTSTVRAATDDGDELREGEAGEKALLTKEAKEAGREAAGPKATDQESLEAYWTPERMKSAKPQRPTRHTKRLWSASKRSRSSSSRAASPTRSRPSKKDASAVSRASLPRSSPATAASREATT